MSATQSLSRPATRPAKAARKRTTPEFLRSAAEEELAAVNEELHTINLLVKENIQQSDRRHLQLRRSASDLDTIFTSFNIALIAVTRDGCIRYFNAEAERLFNLLPSDIGRPVGHLNLGSNCVDVKALICGAINGQSLREEFVDEKGCGRSLRVRPTIDASDSVDGAVLVITNIDELRRTQKTPELRKVETVCCREQAMSSIAAELTPTLMSMLGWVNLLRSGALSDSQVDRVLGILERNAEEQRQMIEVLLPSDA